MTNNVSTPSTPQPSRKRATVLLAAGGYLNTAVIVVQGLLLMPLYLHYIGAHTYGLWLASGGILGMLALVNFGVGSLLIQRVANAYGQQDTALAAAYFINGMLVYICICMLYSAIGWGVSGWLPEILNTDSSDTLLLSKCFQLAVIAMAVAIINECLRSFTQALLRPVAPMLGMAMGRVLGILVTIWMLLNDFGLWAIPVGLFVAEVITFVVNVFCVVLLFKKLHAKVTLNYKIMQEYLHTSPALLMANGANTLSQQSEPLLITILLTPEMTTAYMITRKAADIVFQGLSVVCGASHSGFSHLVGERNLKKTIKIISKLLLVVFSTSLIAYAAYVGANQFFITLWIGENFALSNDVVLMIGVAFFSRSLRAMVWQLLNGLGDFFYTSMIIMAEGLMRIVLAFFLLGSIGILGLPLALFFTCLFSLVLLLVRMKTMLEIKIKTSLLARVVVSVFILFLVSALMINTTLPVDSWWQFIFYLTTILCAFSFILIGINWNLYKNIESKTGIWKL